MTGHMFKKCNSLAPSIFFGYFQNLVKLWDFLKEFAHFFVFKKYTYINFLLIATKLGVL